MASERPRQVEALLQEARSLPPAERLAFLRDRTHGDDSLRLGLESRLEQSPSAVTLPPEAAATAGLAYGALEGQTFSHFRVITSPARAYAAHRRLRVHHRLADAQ